MSITLDRSEPLENALDHIVPGTQEVQQEADAFDQTILTGSLAGDPTWQAKTDQAPEGLLDFDPHETYNATLSNADTRCPEVN